MMHMQAKSNIRVLTLVRNKHGHLITIYLAKEDGAKLIVFACASGGASQCTYTPRWS